MDSNFVRECHPHSNLVFSYYANPVDAASHTTLRVPRWPSLGDASLASEISRQIRASVIP